MSTRKRKHEVAAVDVLDQQETAVIPVEKQQNDKLPTLGSVPGWKTVDDWLLKHDAIAVKIGNTHDILRSHVILYRAAYHINQKHEPMLLVLRCDHAFMERNGWPCSIVPDYWYPDVLEREGGVQHTKGRKPPAEHLWDHLKRVVPLVAMFNLGPTPADSTKLSTVGGVAATVCGDAFWQTLHPGIWWRRVTAPCLWIRRWPEDRWTCLWATPVSTRNYSTSSDIHMPSDRVTYTVDAAVFTHRLSVIGSSFFSPSLIECKARHSVYSASGYNRNPPAPMHPLVWESVLDRATVWLSLSTHLDVADRAFVARMSAWTGDWRSILSDFCKNHSYDGQCLSVAPCGPWRVNEKSAARKGEDSGGDEEGDADVDKEDDDDEAEEEEEEYNGPLPRHALCKTSSETDVFIQCVIQSAAEVIGVVETGFFIRELLGHFGAGTQLSEALNALLNSLLLRGQIWESDLATQSPYRVSFVQALDRSLAPPLLQLCLDYLPAYDCTRPLASGRDSVWRRPTDGCDGYGVFPESKLLFSSHSPS